MQIIGPAEQLCAPPLAGQPATARWRTASKDERRRVAGGPQRAVAGTCGPTAVGVAPAWIVYMYTDSPSPGGSGVGRSRQVCAASTAAARLQVRAATISRGAWDFQVAPARARRPASKGGKVVPVARPSGTPPAAPGRFPQLPRQRRLRSRPTKTVMVTVATCEGSEVGRERWWLWKRVRVAYVAVFWLCSERPTSYANGILEGAPPWRPYGRNFDLEIGLGSIVAYEVEYGPRMTTAARPSLGRRRGTLFLSRGFGGRLGGGELGGGLAARRWRRVRARRRGASGGGFGGGFGWPTLPFFGCAGCLLRKC